MLYFFLFYFAIVISLIVSREILFFNEELLIASCMSLVFFFLVRFFRKLIATVLYTRIEFIYFSFLKLILLNTKVLDKMLNLVSLEDLRFDSVIIFQLYHFFFDFFIEVMTSSKNLSLMFVKNFVFSFITNLFTLNFISISNNFVSIFNLNSNDYLVQDFSVNEATYVISLKRSDQSEDIINIEGKSDATANFISEFGALILGDDELFEKLLGYAAFDKIVEDNVETSSIEDSEIVEDDSENTFESVEELADDSESILFEE